MKKLTNEDVYHVAHLSRIHIDDKDISTYKSELELLMNEIDKITAVDIETDELLITPSEEVNRYRNDEPITSNQDVLSNAPKKNGNYIEIRRFVND